MLVFPNAKINIGLYITDKRQDGYHNLQTLFYPVDFKDMLEIIDHPDGKEDIILSQSGLAINGSSEQNLCIKAYRMLKTKFPDLPPIKLYLHKQIPMGAGLGGGSSDGAFMLQMLNNKFKLGIKQDLLLDYALQLGSDAPFFIYNKPCIASGRGEQLQPISLDLSPYTILIVNPGIHVSTAQAFSWIHPQQPKLNLSAIATIPVSDWKLYFKNDFEAPVSAQYPEIAYLKSLLYEKGAIYASMSGSGSTVYGLFEKNMHMDFNFPDHYFYKWV
jgi:4-diphosphocytidyl-2-C-methyl-D-erythritol kinase